MDIELSHEQRMLLETVQAFLEQEIYPHEEEVDRLGRVPLELGRQIEKRAIEVGLFAANLPESVGGFLSASELCNVIENSGLKVDSYEKLALGTVAIYKCSKNSKNS